MLTVIKIFRTFKLEFFQFVQVTLRVVLFSQKLEHYSQQLDEY